MGIDPLSLLEVATVAAVPDRAGVPALPLGISPPAPLPVPWPPPPFPLPLVVVAIEEVPEAVLAAVDMAVEAPEIIPEPDETADEPAVIALLPAAAAPDERLMAPLLTVERALPTPLVALAKTLLPRPVAAADGATTAPVSRAEAPPSPPCLALNCRLESGLINHRDEEHQDPTLEPASAETASSEMRTAVVEKRISMVGVQSKIPLIDTLDCPSNNRFS